jgi:hypothetical protein
MFDLCASTIMTMINNTSKRVRIFSCNLHLEMGGIFCPYALLSLLNKKILRGREAVVGHFKFAFS